MEWTTLDDDRGPLLTYVEDTRDGLPIADLAKVASGRRHDEAAAAAVEHLCGWLLASESADLVEALLARGARQVRHARVMTADTAPHVAAPEVALVARTARPVGDLLEGWKSAYPVGHPDHEEGTDADLIARCWDWYDTPPWPEREHRSSGLVVRDGRVVAGIIVSLRPEPVPYGGPWIQDVWRAPEAAGAGYGSALIAQSMRMLHEDGFATLGLAVSEGNPAERTYQRLGFAVALEAWTLRLPD